MAAVRHRWWVAVWTAFLVMGVIDRAWILAALAAVMTMREASGLDDEGEDYR